MNIRRKNKNQKFCIFEQVWFGGNLKIEISIPKNLAIDPLYTHLAKKMAKNWVFKTLVGFGLAKTSKMKSAYPKTWQ